MPKLTPRWRGDKDPVPAYRDHELQQFADAIFQAKNMWKDDLEASGGDKGTCVIGAGLAVWYLPPRARKVRERIILSPPGQGDGSWCRARAEACLKAAGVEGLHFEYGRMD